MHEDIRSSTLRSDEAISSLGPVEPLHSTTSHCIISKLNLRDLIGACSHPPGIERQAVSPITLAPTQSLAKERFLRALVRSCEGTMSGYSSSGSCAISRST